MRTRLRSLVPLLAALFWMGCGPEVSNEECGGHGYLHGDHCHCDDGYVEQDGTCVVGPPAAECGGHGHLHGSTCHCDAGYVAEGTTCLPVTVDPLDPLEFDIVAIGYRTPRASPSRSTTPGRSPGT